MKTLGDFIRKNAKLYPEKTAFTFREKRITFKEFDARVNRLTNALANKGIRKGNRVAVLSKNCHHYFEAFGSAWKGGFILTPLNYRLAPKELIYLINDSQPIAFFLGPEYIKGVESIRNDIPSVKVFICWENKGMGIDEYEELLASSSDREPEIDISENDVAYIFYTSGTTGVPRGAMHTHAGQIESVKSLLVEMDSIPQDRYLSVMPLFGMGGYIITLIHFCRGCTVILMKEYDTEEVLRLVEREKISVMQVVPSMIAFMLELPNLNDYDLSSLRTILYASAPMPVSLLKRGIEKFGNIFFQAYGQTETGPLVSVLWKQDHVLDGDSNEVRKLASCGLPALTAEVRVVNEAKNDVVPGEVGEIITRSAHIMKGYWEKPDFTEETIRNGWVFTGDMATVDEEGYIYIVDRKKDMIISGGLNIYPKEIEEVLYSHPAVLEAAVIGVPDEKWGETVKALVVLRPGKKLKEEEIIEYCKGNLASYKKPKSVEFLECLPKTPTGKILKTLLREKYWKGLDRKV